MANTNTGQVPLDSTNTTAPVQSDSLMNDTEAASPPDRQNGVTISEQHWIWKTVFRGVLAIGALITLIASAWLLGTEVVPPADAYLFYSDESWAWIFTIVASSVSLTWSSAWLICLCLIPALRRRRSHRATSSGDTSVITAAAGPHPGIAVALDLLLWIALLIVGFFALNNYSITSYFGSGGTIEDPQLYDRRYEGDYIYSQSQHKWIFEITYVDPVNNPPGTNIHNINRGNCHPAFNSCAAQDAFVNKLWNSKGSRESEELMVTVLCWTLTLLHFTVFVWACVDTHTRRLKTVGNKARQLADEIISDLHDRGMITVHGQDMRAGDRRNISLRSGQVNALQQQDVVGLQPMTHRHGERGQLLQTGGQRNDEILRSEEARVRYS